MDQFGSEDRIASGIRSGLAAMTDRGHGPAVMRNVDADPYMTTGSQSPAHIFRKLDQFTREKIRFSDPLDGDPLGGSTPRWTAVRRSGPQLLST